MNVFVAREKVGDGWNSCCRTTEVGCRYGAIYQEAEQGGVLTHATNICQEKRTSEAGGRCTYCPKDVQDPMARGGSPM